MMSKAAIPKFFQNYLLSRIPSSARTRSRHSSNYGSQPTDREKWRQKGPEAQSTAVEEKFDVDVGMSHMIDKRNQVDDSVSSKAIDCMSDDEVRKTYEDLGEKQRRMLRTVKLEYERMVMTGERVGLVIGGSGLNQNYFCYAPAIKWPGHMVLPLSFIPSFQIQFPLII